MLVITREVSTKNDRKDEFVMTDAEGNEIVVKVLRVTGNKVRLGIEAGSSIGILRGELIDRNNQQEPFLKAS
jgi:carbon storage regulator CsrA